MNALLKDETTYKKLNKDPIKSLTSKINCLVKAWRDKDVIDESTYRMLRCTERNTPRCYGLPKIHKAGLPLRIIVSTLGSPLYNIARYLHDILREATCKPVSYVKDSWSFVDIIKSKKITTDALLVSLDVTSLFTNISRKLVFNAIENR